MNKHSHDFQVIESIHTLSGRGNHKKDWKKEKKRLNVSSNGSLMFWNCVWLFREKLLFGMYIYYNYKIFFTNQNLT